MLNKLNKLYRKIIVQDCIQEDFQKLISAQTWRKQIYDDETFLNTYLKPLNENLLISLDMQNTFRIDGLWKDVKDFLKKFKVDNKFIQKPEEFEIYAPMIVFSTNSFGHVNQFNEGFIPANAFNKNYTMTNAIGILQGRWMDLLDNNTENEYAIKVKHCTPKQLIDIIEYNIKINGYEDLKDKLCIALEFYVNCSGFANGRLEEHSETIPLRKNGKTIADDLNDRDKDLKPTVITKETRNKTIKVEIKPKTRKKKK